MRKESRMYNSFLTRKTTGAMSGKNVKINVRITDRAGDAGFWEAISGWKIDVLVVGTTCLHT